MKKALLHICLIMLILPLLTACGNKQENSNTEAPQNSSVATDYDKGDNHVSRDTDLYVEEEESSASNIVSYFVEERANETYEYDVYSDHIVITGITQIGPDGELSIPAEIDGLPVLAIDNTESPHNWFKSLDKLSDLKTLVLSDGIEYLGNGVFSRCYNLQSVTIPDSILEIGTGAFFETPWLDSHTDEFVIVGDGVLLKYNGSDSVVYIPAEVKYVSAAFVNNKPVDIWDETLNNALIEVFIPDSVTTLGIGAFAGSTYLQSVHFSNSLQKIGPAAFAGCTSLTNIQLPDGLIEIGAEAFYQCTALAKVGVPLSVKTIGSNAFAGTLFRKECTDEFQIIGDGIMISYNGNDTDIIIPVGVKSIACGSSGLSGRNSLHSITLPDTVICIGDEAFSECRNLQRISIPSHLEYIGASAFSGCGRLQSVFLPDSVQYIGESAFRSCDEITSFRIPIQIRDIKPETLAYCYGLETVYIPPSVENIAEDAFDGCDIFVYCCEEGSWGYEYAMERVSYPHPCIALKQTDGTFLRESMHTGILYYTTYNELLLQTRYEQYEADFAGDNIVRGAFLNAEMYTYDEYGNVISKIEYDSNETVLEHTKSEYTADGLIIKSSTYDSNSDLIEYTDFEYFENNSISSKRKYNHNGILIEEMLYNRIIGWEEHRIYDSDGNLCQTRKREQANNQNYVYTYDASGNLIETRSY